VPPWTIETLKEYFDALFDEREKSLLALTVERDNNFAHRLRAVEELARELSAIKQDVAANQEKLQAQERQVAVAFESTQRAIDKAERAQELRNTVANEFRAQLGDQAATFMPRKESESALLGVQHRLEESVRAGRQEMVGKYEALRQEMVARYDGLRQEVFGRYDALEKNFDEERRRADKGEGRQIGQAAVVGFIVSAIVVVGTVIGIIVAVS
jgi:hypothetical protein